ELALDEVGVYEVDLGGGGGRRGGPRGADSGEGEGDRLVDDVGRGGVDRVEIEARAAAGAAPDVLVGGWGDARAVVATWAGDGGIGGVGDVLDALDDAPRAERAARELLDEVLLGDHGRLRGERTRPRVRIAGVEIERHVGSRSTGSRGAKLVGAA